MKSLGVICYQTRHLKTEQIVSLLHERYAIKLYALPFTPRPERKVLFQHRPDQFSAAFPQELCRQFDMEYIPVDSDEEIDGGCDFYLITAGALLSGPCVRKNRVLNAHPGIIPAVRGLDAFKWAIFEQLPVGITLHYIDENIDEGEVISVVSTPVFRSDTIDSLARRHYEREIQLLADFERYLETPVNLYQNIEKRESTRRMKMETEQLMLEKFEQYKETYAK